MGVQVVPVVLSTVNPSQGLPDLQQLDQNHQKIEIIDLTSEP